MITVFNFIYYNKFCFKESYIKIIELRTKANELCIQIVLTTIDLIFLEKIIFFSSEWFGK